jgi:hypothetical protein
MTPTRQIDPAVDVMARLYEHLCRTELGVHKLIVDRQTQHCRPEFVRVFQVLLDVAQEHGLTPRQQIDAIIAGSRARRHSDPQFRPKTRDLAIPSYRRRILKAR